MGLRDSVEGVPAGVVEEGGSGGVMDACGGEFMDHALAEVVDFQEDTSPIGAGGAL